VRGTHDLKETIEYFDILEVFTGDHQAE